MFDRELLESAMFRKLGLVTVTIKCEWVPNEKANKVGPLAT